MFIKRDIQKILKAYAKFPIVAILGPRQSGKTTLAQNAFKKHAFVSLEAIDNREYAQSDPRGFLKKHENKNGLIIDEFQYVPDLLSYIQVEADQKQRPGYFVLTGSQNFLMNQAISQSLAGRVGLLTLLPLSLHELHTQNALHTVEESLLYGSYPRIFSQNIAPEIYYNSYIHTYVERDIQELSAIKDMRDFRKFLRACAARSGQQLDIVDLCTTVGIDRITVKKWLSALEASYIIFFLEPYYNNFNKRLTKSPKLYFYDTGLVCSLLSIQSLKDPILTSFRGPLFESMIISDLYKQYCNSGLTPSMYYWREANGRLEIDCIINQGGQLTPIEIKSGETIVRDFFTNLDKWTNLAHVDPAQSYIIYGGDDEQTRRIGHALSWKKAGTLLRKVTKK